MHFINVSFSDILCILNCFYSDLSLSLLNRYKEYHDLRFEQILMFCMGLVLVLIGVQIMSQRKAATSDDNSNSTDDDDDNNVKRNQKRQEEKRRKKKSNTNNQQAGTGGSVSDYDDLDASSRLGTERTSDVEDDNGTFDDGVNEGEEDEPTEGDRLLGNYDGSHTPATPPHDTHSHLASACSFPGVLIDSAARSVRRPVKRTGIRSGGGGGSVGGHYYISRNAGSVQKGGSAGSSVNTGALIYDDDCV